MSPALFTPFWDMVRSALRPRGRVFFIDELMDAWRHEHLHEEFVDDASIPAVRQSLRDGRTFRVVKLFWDEQKLQSRLDDLGWSIEVESIILRS
jgi:hypothetical protein